MVIRFWVVDRMAHPPILRVCEFGEDEASEADYLIEDCTPYGYDAVYGALAYGETPPKTVAEAWALYRERLARESEDRVSMASGAEVEPEACPF